MIERFFKMFQKEKPEIQEPQVRLGDLTATALEVRGALKDIIRKNPEAKKVLSAYVELMSANSYVQIFSTDEGDTLNLVSALEMQKTATVEYDRIMKNPGSGLILEEIQIQEEKMRVSARASGNSDPDDDALQAIGSALV